MNKSDCRYNLYINILKEELVPAMGCTEPICLAYAAAKAKNILGEMPDKVEILASGNIIKNVKSVLYDYFLSITAAYFSIISIG